jgi:hypothetical protein
MWVHGCHEEIGPFNALALTDLANIRVVGYFQIEPLSSARVHTRC